MNKAFEKILERLEERCDVIVVSKEEHLPFSNVISNPLIAEKDYDASITIKEAMKIVQEVAEKFTTDTNVGTNGWIACSDQLPEENQEVILQDFYGNITIEKMEINDGAKGFSDGNWWSSANNYVAWQPLPEPYKESEE